MDARRATGCIGNAAAGCSSSIWCCSFIPTLRDEDVQALHALLDLPDNDLWDIIIGRSDRYDPRFEQTVARLRAA